MDLITLDNYKTAKAMTSTKEDDRIEFVISAVSQLIKAYCGITFVDYYSTAYTEYFDVSYSTKRIELGEIPVIAISEVWERSAETEDYTLLTADDYTLSRRTDSIHRNYTTWPTGIESVKVTYTAGYLTLPGDLQLAVIDLVTYYLKDEYKISKSMMGTSTTNTPSTKILGNIGLPDHIKRVLDMYRQI